MPLSLPTLRTLLVAMLLAAGCRNLPEQVGKSPLRPLRMSPDTVIVDVFFVRIPFDDPDANGPLWTEIDETTLPPAVRQRLASNGFRVGLVAGQVPPVPLSKLLELKDKPVVTGPIHDTDAADMTDEPRVSERHMPLHCGQHGKVFTSGPYDELHVLVRGRSGVEGETFHDARPVLGASAALEPDGRVRLKLIPEVQFGSPKPTLVGQPGIMRLEPNQPKQVYPEMTVDASAPPARCSSWAASGTAGEPGPPLFHARRPAAGWNRNCSSSGSARRSATGCSIRWTCFRSTRRRQDIRDRRRSACRRLVGRRRRPGHRSVRSRRGRSDRGRG